MKPLSKIGIKWIAYSIELFLIFTLEQTPGLIPELFGVTPSLIMCVCISIAVFEGEMPAMMFGLAGGLLMDFGSRTIFGFNAFFLTVLCYLCGLLVVNLMRNNIVTTMVLGAGVLLIMGIVRWFFFYVLWGYPSLWFHFYAVMLPCALYSVIILPLFFYLNRVISTYLSYE